MASPRSILLGMLVFALGVTASPAAPARASTPEPPSFSAWSVDGGSDDYEQVVDITYPTAGGTTYSDDYAEERGGGARVHGATDILGTMGEKVYAAQGGEIVWMPGQDPPDKHPTAGYGMQINGTDGRMYAYYHLGGDGDGASGAFAQGLENGDTVVRGQHLGYLGDSGNAAGGSPHLHFEIHDDRVTDPSGTNRINPYPSLQDAEQRGDYPPDDAGEDAGPRLDVDRPDRSAGDGGLPPVDRVAGSDRIRTAIELSKSVFDAADHAVLAAAGSFADSVAAAPLAAGLSGPVLTTRGAALEQPVIDELHRLGATRVTIVGGTSAVPAQVERDLVERGDLAPSRIDRLAGANRYETAAEIARSVWAAGGTRRAGVALGDHEEEHRAWPDALAAGYHGAVTGTPVLLITPGGVPAATATALEGVAEVTVVGGPGVVSDGVYATVDGLAGTVRRLAGPDRYMTAAAVAGDLLGRGVWPDRVWAATGHDFADALAAAPAAARQGELLLLVDGQDGGKDDRLAAWLGELSGQIKTGRVVGGPSAVSEAARHRLAERIAGSG